MILRRNTFAFCHHAGGRLEAIGPDHFLSPVSLPPPPGCTYLGPYALAELNATLADMNPYTNATEWAVTDQSRPFVCSVPKYNFVLVNAFHYGLRDTDEFIMNHGHFYAPGKWEGTFLFPRSSLLRTDARSVTDRLDLIIIPILEKLSTLLDRPVAPDMISITSVSLPP